MDFDWSNEETGDIARREIEESFEDPFSIRLLPDAEGPAAVEARYFILGRSISGTPVFTVFWTDGKTYRVIFSRRMTSEEEGFYERKNSEANA